MSESTLLLHLGRQADSAHHYSSNFSEEIHTLKTSNCKFIFLNQHDIWIKQSMQIPYLLFLSCKHLDAKFEIYEVNTGNW